MIRRVQFRELDESAMACSCSPSECVLELLDLSLQDVYLTFVSVTECEAVASEESV